MSEEKTVPDRMGDVLEILARHKQEDAPDTRQEPPEDEEARKLCLAELRSLLDRMPLADIARTIEALEPEDRLIVWYEVREERGEAILEILSDEVRQDLICDSHLRNEKDFRHGFRIAQRPVEPN